MRWKVHVARMGEGDERYNQGFGGKTLAKETISKTQT
jgi:hypothetical protein